jgi:Glu-tRNA(Gln) amidotransferase subunit E-like FAD-binding protein
MKKPTKATAAKKKTVKKVVKKKVAKRTTTKKVSEISKQDLTDVFYVALMGVAQKEIKKSLLKYHKLSEKQAKEISSLIYDTELDYAINDLLESYFSEEAYKEDNFNEKVISIVD